MCSQECGRVTETLVCWPESDKLSGGTPRDPRTGQDQRAKLSLIEATTEPCRSLVKKRSKCDIGRKDERKVEGS